MNNDNTLQDLHERLDRMALEQLRQVAAELHQRLGQTEAQLLDAEAGAEFWQQHAMDLQQALSDEEYSTHRCVGMSKSGESMVVRTDH